MSYSVKRVDVLGTKVSAASFDGAIEQLSQLVSSGANAYVSCANAFSTTMAMDDPEYRELLNKATIVTTDGMPVVWVLKLLGFDTVERVHNDDLVLECCERFPGWRHFLVGGRDGQPEQVAEALRARFPGIDIVGMHATPNRPVSDEITQSIIEEIAAVKPHVVWVGMGTPAQDVWMNRVVDRVGAPLVGCGSLFDLLSGRTKPAPEWMKRSGLQWLFRLLQEPRRLLFRYAYYNSKFVFGVMRQLVFARHNTPQ
ncbi:MAG: WecB/TagA/CpsF family glycosyltransferase [Chromatiales bacterium]|nr:WecB/TagA/CpsF family glycosyltransferase [Chromatiales bacterium]